MHRQQDIVYLVIEVAFNFGLFLLVLGMLVLQGGRSVLSNGSRLIRVRFASTVASGNGKEKEKLVILGSGWGGYNVAR